MNYLIKSCSALVIIISLAACGGGGGGTSAPVTSTGKFIDGPVSGLGYSCGTKSGITKDDGSFTYEVGKTAKFFIGGIILGEALAGEVVTPLHLVPGSNLSNPQIINIGRFLLSIASVDPVSLKITIPNEVSAAAKGIIKDVKNMTGPELLALVQAVKPGASLVTEEAAKDHMSQCVYQLYSGNYSGAFTGPAPSKGFEIKLSANGDVTGSGINPVGETITGKLTNGTEFNGIASGGCILTGRLDVLTGVLSGTWRTPDATGSGTFSGTR